MDNNHVKAYTETDYIYAYKSWIMYFLYVKNYKPKGGANTFVYV
jgi:hypothetical protein